MPSLFPGFKARFESATRAVPTQRSTEFAFALLKTLNPGEQNLTISPYSVRVVLGMLLAGSSHETRREIAAAGRFNEDPESRENHYERLGRPLGFQLETERRELEMYTANALWCDWGFSLKEEYAKSMKADYWAEARALDFKAEASAETVNTWASENTRGRIPLVVNADVLRDSSPLIAMNAVYFRGLWEKPFEKELTKDEAFTLADGSKKLVPMMEQSGEFSYGERRGAQMVRLAYRGGMSMYVVLPPKKTSIPKFCAELRETLGMDWARHMRHREGRVRMARFRMEGSVDLTKSLQAMGISRAFDSARAALDGIGVGGGLFLRGITQSDFIEVNEKGTEAAAVTQLFCLGTPEPDWQPPFEMTVDRPFLFAICDDYTSTIVFLGVVVDPEASYLKASTG